MPEAPLVAALAEELGAAAAFYLPSTPNGRAVVEAWHAAGDGEPQRPERIGTLLISGEEAAADPVVRSLAEQADAVIAITMFADPVRGWADLVLPATSYLERDGTIVNLEGRPQRLRRAVIPPAPDEVAWIAKLAERFGVVVDPHARAVEADEQAALPRARRAGAGDAPEGAAGADREGRPAQARPLPRPVLRPGGRARAGAPVPAAGAGDRALRPRRRARGTSPTGEEVVVRSNGTSVRMRARVNRQLVDGAVRAPEEHVRELEARPWR